MKKIKNSILALAIMFGASFCAVPAFAATVFEDACSGSDSALCEDQSTDVGSVVNVIVNTLLYVLGAVCVIVIIIGGVFYVTSMGNASSVEKAKNTILYAVIGLVVALLAYAIVNFVIGKFIF